jgi:hypothetical protein
MNSDIRLSFRAIRGRLLVLIFVVRLYLPESVDHSDPATLASLTLRVMRK